MADHVLDDFAEADARNGTHREVSFNSNDEVLTVTLRHGPGDYEEHHYLLTEVVRRWAPVEPDVTPDRRVATNPFGERDG